MAESPRGLAARWAASGLGMADELTGEPSAAREEAECMSEMASDDAHDELMCSMDVIAEVHVQDTEREQQRERVSVGCVTRNDVGAGDSGSGAARAFECGDDGVVVGCEGVDGVEQGAFMAARAAEGDDEDEVMAGDENISVQRAEGGSGSIGGIKKRGHRGRSKEAKAERRKRIDKYGGKSP